VTYFGVLLRFIGLPILFLLAIALYDRRMGRSRPKAWRIWSAGAVLAAHVLVAIVYTTPWDNYLVANRIWWYDPSLVTGILIGWVPIEEYTFFVVQTCMAGLWLLLWMRRLRLPQDSFTASHTLRRASAVGVGVLWVAWLALLLAGWTPGLYMALLLVWFLPPIVLQLSFGADILWHHRRLVLAGLVPPFVYLCVVDALAISGGTWTINPENTVGLDLAGVLPLEEIVFFLVTSTLIVMGMVLMLAEESHIRANLMLSKMRGKMG
jgi:lycopene cyclase domain-containing protein